MFAHLSLSSDCEFYEGIAEGFFGCCCQVIIDCRLLGGTNVHMMLKLLNFSSCDGLCMLLDNLRIMFVTGMCYIQLQL